MVKFLAGAVAVLVIMGICGLSIVQTGAFDVRASTPHSAFVAWATHTTMIHAAQREGAKVRTPATFTPQQVITGYREYVANCETCHGGPGVERAVWVNGMNPPPPYLIDASRHWTPGELYWIIDNGIKMTGMPAWGASQHSAEVWDEVAFLRALPYFSPADYARMKASQGASSRPDPLKPRPSSRPPAP